MAVKSTSFDPDYISLPGETLEEILEEKGIKKISFSKKTGISQKDINEIIHGKAPITPDKAQKFELVLGTPASFWNNREKKYREILAKLDEAERMENWYEWAKNFDLSELKRRKIIPLSSDKTTIVRAVLCFFGIVAPTEFENVWLNPLVAYRQSDRYEPNPYILASWLREGENAANSIKCSSYDKNKFKQALSKIRALSMNLTKQLDDKILEISFEAGVIILFVREYKVMATSGASYWIRPDKPVIQLTLRFKKIDQIWFSLFHEAGHIIKEHCKKDRILEYDGKIKDDKEKEADRFAANFLIPPSNYRTFVSKRNFDKTSIINFSNSIEIAPGIVLGRLQHDKHIVWNTSLNNLKTSIEWG